jgi:hypothetical protein
MITSTVEIVGILVLITYTIFSGVQWAQMRWTNRLTRESINGSDKSLKQTLEKMQGQIEATNKLYGEAQQQTQKLAAQAKAAQDTADTAQKALTLDNRAWVGLESVTPTFYAQYPTIQVKTVGGKNMTFNANVQLTVEFVVRNLGHSAAQHVQMFPELLFTQSPDLHRNDPGCKPSYPRNDLGYDVLPGQPLLLTHGLRAEFPPDVIEAGKQPRDPGMLLRILGCIVYSDNVSKGKIHHTPFSYALEYNGQSDIPRNLPKSDGSLWKAKQLPIDPGPAD